MDGSALANLSDPELVAARDRHLIRLADLYQAPAASLPLALCGHLGRGQADPYREPERWVDDCLADLAGRAAALRDTFVFRPLVVEYGPYGVHFVDRILGGHVFELEPGNWQAQPLGTAPGQLVPPDLERDPTWALARRAAAAFVERGASVPLFGLPTIASALNVGMNLYGQELLVAMLLEPEAVRRDLRLINGVLADLHHWYLGHVPLIQVQPVVAAWRTQPPGFGQICGCSTQLLSAQQYAEFIAPLDDALLGVYPGGGMIHLCGSHTQHLAAWRAMRSLRAVQLNDRAAEELEAYCAGLRPDQVLYVNPCPGMPVRRILDITRGRPTVVVADLSAWPDVRSRG